ncbi:protein FAM53A isoform X2 [Cynocephalus volans]|uniref:protein FAM53A isoform X2 n=1 Tax=Cynocephalus volans TaxID=110931 RepID=UPI002FC5DFE6
MVTLITEKLQNQSLDDLARKTCEAGLHSAEKLNTNGCLFPLEISDKSPWKVLSGGRPLRSQVAVGPDFPFPPGPSSVVHTTGLQWRPESPVPCTSLGVDSASDLNENTGPPAAPPSKRHCRSLSEPEELARCQSPWRPGGFKVWTPVSKRRCNSGGSATLQRCSGLGSTGLPSSAASLPGLTLPLAPRPSSAISGFLDSSEGSTSSGRPWHPKGPCLRSSRRRLSLSQEHLADTGTPLPSASSTPSSTPELGRRHGLLRCRSQPCVLNGKRSRRKRRREEDTRWTRPCLDFLKMTRCYSCAQHVMPGSAGTRGQEQRREATSGRPTGSALTGPGTARAREVLMTLKNSKSLCSLDHEDDEDDTQVKTVVSSPCDSRDLLGIVMPGSSPWASRERAASDGRGGSSRDPSDWDSAGEEGVFPLDHSELDLEQIENN